MQTSSATAEEAVASPEKAEENLVSSSNPAATSKTTSTAGLPTRPFKDIITDLGEKDIGLKRPELASFPKYVIGNINLAFSVFYY